jgi:O-antigen ligase
MWVLPFLHYRHQYPLTTFHQEWWSALLGVLALVLLVAHDYWQRPEIPRIVQLPVALIAVILLQWGLGKMVYSNQALLYALYLMFAMLLMLLGARLREKFSMEKLAQVLAVFLLIGAELSAMIGILQQYRWHTPLDSVVVMKVSSGVFGNLAQPNHFANYIALGLISLGLLYRQRKLKAGYVALLAVPLLFVMTLSGSRSSWLYLLLMCGLAWWWTRRDAGQRALLRYSLLLISGFGLMHLAVQLPFMSVTDDTVNTVQRLVGNAASSGSIRPHLWYEAVLIFMQSPWLGAGFGQFAWQHFQLQPALFQSNVTGLYNNAHNLIFQLAAETGVAGLLVLFASLGVWLYGLRRATLDAAHWWGYAALGVLAIHSLLEYPLWYIYFLAVAAILLGALDETRYHLELRNVGRMFVVAIMLLGLLTLAQLRNGHRQLEQAMGISSAPATGSTAFEHTRDMLAAIHGGSLLSPYAELSMSALIEINDEHLNEKLELNTRVMHFVPIAVVAYRQALLLAQSGRQEQAKTIIEQAVWSYPGDFAATRQQLAGLAEKDPAHFSALLEFAVRKEQEYQRAVHQY